MEKDKLGILQVTIATLFFAFITVLVRLGKDIGPYNLSFARIFLMAFFILLFSIITSNKIIPFKHEGGKLIFFGILHALVILGVFISINLLSIASAVLLIYSLVIWVVIFSRFILKEKITRKTLIALIMGVIGVIIVLYQKDLFVNYSNLGLIAGLLSGVGGALVYVLSKTFKKYDRISLVFWQNIIALPFIFPLIFIYIPKFTINNGLLVLFLGLLSTISFVLTFKGFEKIKAQTGGIIVILDIPFSMFFAFLFFKEIPNLREFIGALLIILSAIIISIKEKELTPEI